MTAPHYEILTTETVSGYIASRPDLAALVDVDTLSVREIGDGNLNLVFIAQDAAGRGLCLKQSLPYVRLVGESWPLTPHRATAEARSYEAAVRAAPELVPVWHGFDAQRFVLAMEDLSDWTVWRSALDAGEVHEGVAGQMGDLVARTAFATSMFGMPIEDVQRAAAAAINPDLCRITEDLVFREPYLDHPHNSVAPGVAPEVARLRSDRRLLTEVGGLLVRFVSVGQALIHGDLHTGSVMVRRTGQGPAARAKAIDGEFCFYGPVGFDTGALIANQLLAMARARVLGRSQPFQAWLRGLPGETWGAFEAGIRRAWPSRVDRFLSDELRDAWIEEVWRDTLGFAGCKAIRRIVGLAKVSDIQTLPSDEHVTAATIVLRTAHRAIVERRALAGPTDLIRILDDVTLEVSR